MEGALVVFLFRPENRSIDLSVYSKRGTNVATRANFLKQGELML
jgi:hypothetical protein